MVGAIHVFVGGVCGFRTASRLNYCNVYEGCDFFSQLTCAQLFFPGDALQNALR